MAVLNTYAAHGLNDLDTYTLHTVHEQDSVVVRHAKCILLLTRYTARNVIRANIVCVLHVSTLQNFLSDLHASVKFKLRCTIYICSNHSVILCIIAIASHNVV